MLFLFFGVFLHFCTNYGSCSSHNLNFGMQVTFVGSIMYFPSISQYVAGGWLFTVGSTGFLIADMWEWWYFRLGCAFDGSFNYPNRHKDLWERAEVGLNFFFSATGSTLYLIGSIEFIPSTELITDGTWTFIYGSAIIFLSQLWKVIRALKTDPNFEHDKRVKLSNVMGDLPALGVDSFAGIGGLFYFFGSILFLPQNIASSADESRASAVFVMGGLSFFISGVFLIYRYFFTLNYPH